MFEHLQEYADSRGVALRVDSAAGVLRGVKLIGLESQNGRRYRPAALSQAVSLYEGAKVNVNHPAAGPLAPRDYRDRLGVIRQVEFRAGEGLFGNLHFNPKHALAEQLVWDAEHNPRNVGFSHNVLARLSREGERAVVEAITHVQSVDLVADPAATQGLFESAGSEKAAAQPAPERLTVLETALRESQDREATLRRRLVILEGLARHGLAIEGAGRDSGASIGPAFYAALVQAGDEAEVESLIAERAESFARAKRESQTAEVPQSQEQTAALAAERGSSRTDFAAAIKSGRARVRSCS